jgi:NADH-quinone oxidoreductase subunit J
MSPIFLFLAGLTLAGAVGAMALRNPVHCALSLVVTFVGLAGVYLDLGAQFLGLVQVLVYVGAVAILLVFVLLVTRSGADETNPPPGGLLRDAWGSGWLAASGVAVVLAIAVSGAARLPGREVAPELPRVRDLGESLMTDFVVPLQAVGVLLTVAMIGAAILALREGRAGVRPGRKEDAR